MRALIALLVSSMLVALLVALTPVQAMVVSEEVETIGQSLDTHAIDTETSDPSLDDDVVHLHPIAGSPVTVIRLAREHRSDEREGVTHSSEPRPPRSA